MPKQPTPSPPSNVPVLRESAVSKKEEKEEDEDEDGESDSETAESSSEEESTTRFVEYDAEPLSKARTQSQRSTVRSVIESSGERQNASEPVVPVALASDRRRVAPVSPVGPVTQAINTAPKSPRSPNYADRSEDLKSRSPGQSSEPSVLPIGRATQPPLLVNTEPAYVGKAPKSPPVRLPVTSNEADYAGKSQPPSSIHSPSTDPGLAVKFERSPVHHSPVAIPEPAVHARKSRRSPDSPLQLEYAEFESEPMSRNPRRNFRHADDDELPTAPLPGSPHKPTSPPVKSPTVNAATPALPTTLLVSTPSSFIQTFEAPSVMVPRAAAGPVLMPPAATSQPTARIEASPVLQVSTRPAQPNNWRRTADVPAADVRPPSVSRMSPHPPSAETGGGDDAVSALFTRLEHGCYSNPPPGRQPLTGGHESSYGPGYRAPTHGAVVRQQEPYPVEV